MPQQDAGMTKENPLAPFRVTGTVLAPREKFVHLIVFDEQGKEEGTIRVREGEKIKGYVVKQIEDHRVCFEKDGQELRIDIGNPGAVSDEKRPRSVSSQAPPLEMKGKIVPPPDNIEELKKEAENFFKKLEEHPEFKRRLEEKKRQIRERQEGAAPAQKSPSPSPQ
jgi:type II secretory pathway component PulC